jgi:UPF0755 protein
MSLSRIFFGFFVLAILGFSGFAWAGYQWLFFPIPPLAATSPTATVSLTIPPGMTAQSIGLQLKAAGLVRSALVFRFWAGLYGVAGRLKPGKYDVKPGQSLEEIIGKLIRGQDETLQVTIPEGLTIPRIAQLLETSGVCPAASFSEAIHSPSLLNRVFGDWGEINNPEGLAFPETYRFSRGISPRAVAETMLTFTREQVDSRAKEIASRGLSPYDACILASVVEREGKIRQDRPLIASVFMNRLQKGIKLESCATVQYAQGFHKDRLLLEDLKIDSPYNTYVNKGLPPTPIANFGADSLAAVASHPATDYFFFVSDASEGHWFSRTLAEHEKSRREFFQKRKALQRQ